MIHCSSDQQHGQAASPRGSHLEIDNNTAERSVRGIGAGKNNYLFIGSDTGGERAAFMYSIIATCKLSHIGSGAARDLNAK